MFKHKNLVTQNKTVAPERQKRAHLLVKGRYGSISCKIILIYSFSVRFSVFICKPQSTDDFHVGIIDVMTAKS